MAPGLAEMIDMRNDLIFVFFSLDKTGRVLYNEVTNQYRACYEVIQQNPNARVSLRLGFFFSKGFVT